MDSADWSLATLHPKLSPGVLWYQDEDRGLVLVASQCFDPGHLRLAADFDVQLLASCDGEQDLAGLASKLSVSTEWAAGALERWDRGSDGLIRWLEPREAKAEAQQEREARTPEMLHQWRADEAVPTDNARYHAEQIRDALEQFEAVEATVSHAFSVEHPALGGRRYGEAFCDAVAGDGQLPVGARILEVGCGTGRLAQGFLDRLRERHGAIYPTVEYTLLELSAELQSSQRQRCAAHAGRTRFVRADIEDHDFRQERFDLVIANEMLGDLSVGRALTENVRCEQAETEAERLMLAYGLSEDDAPPDVVVNVGAIRFVERLSALLRDGGVAALTEHGSEEFWPAAVQLGDHTEFSIQFGHLAVVARQLGLEAEVRSLGEWLEFDRSFEVLSFDQLWLLGDHVLPFLGCEPLPTLAYDVSMLRRRLGALIDRVGNLDFQPLERWDALNPFESFCVLLIRR